MKQAECQAANRYHIRVAHYKPDNNTMMYKNLLLLISVNALCLLHAVEVAAQAARTVTIQKIAGVKPRNVIYILSDDHRYDFMGFTGKVPGLETPNMDRLAREGVHLQNA